jgi:hypothetical protein
VFCEGSYVYKEGHPTLGHTYSMELMSFMKDTSLNLVPNAQVCVYLTVHITKLQLQTTF